MEEVRGLSSSFSIKLLVRPTFLVVLEAFWAWGWNPLSASRTGLWFGYISLG
jgi:hypothetical protein